jgi:hypothetical protein
VALAYRCTSSRGNARAIQLNAFQPTDQRAISSPRTSQCLKPGDIGDGNGHTARENIAIDVGKIRYPCFFHRSQEHAVCGREDIITRPKTVYSICIRSSGSRCSRFRECLRYVYLYGVDGRRRPEKVMGKIHLY